MGAIKSPKCSKGHRFTAENTYQRKDGTRECKKCSKARRLKYWYDVQKKSKSAA